MWNAGIVFYLLHRVFSPFFPRGATHMLVCVVIIKQAFKFHPLNTDLEQVKIATLITDQLVKWGPFSLTSCIWAPLSLTSCIWPIWTPFSLTYIKKVPLSTDLQKKKKKKKRSLTNHFHGLISFTKLCVEQFHPITLIKIILHLLPCDMWTVEELHTMPQLRNTWLIPSLIVIYTLPGKLHDVLYPVLVHSGSGGDIFFVHDLSKFIP